MDFTVKEDEYWSRRYENGNTGWDIGSISTPLKDYIDQISDKDIRILIPGAGNAYEAEYLHNEGFTNVSVLDISQLPLKALTKRVPDFPTSNLIHGNFFEHSNSYDLIFEQTFFCSFEPTEGNRKRYAAKMAELLASGGKLVGLWFKHDLLQGVSKRPFGGTKEDYLDYLEPYFKVAIFDNCYNSIPPRSGNELFGIFIKK